MYPATGSCFAQSLCAINMAKMCLFQVALSNRYKRSDLNRVLDLKMLKMLVNFEEMRQNALRNAENNNRCLFFRSPVHRN